MPEEAKTNETEQNVETAGENKQPEAQLPTIEQVMTQLKQAQTEILRNKNAMDKVMSENKNLKDQLRKQMTAEQQESEAKREAEEQHKAYVKGLEDKITRIETVARYVDMGMDKELAEATTEAELSGDKAAVSANIKKWTDSLVKAKEAEWLRTRPVPQSGGGEVTKEQFDKMTLMQKSELFERDPALYHKLLGR